MHQLGQMKFDRLTLDEYWTKVVGTPEKSHTVMIYGDSGNGKTTSIIRYLKPLLNLGYCAGYISHEEGISATMQGAFDKEDMISSHSGSLILIEQATFLDTMRYFGKRGSPGVGVVDSIDYCKLTEAQYKLLRGDKNADPEAQGMSREEYETMRRILSKKIWILISWSEGSKPKSTAGKAFEYMVDIKLFIKNFMIWPKSRYGGNQPAPVWEERARLLEPKYWAKIDAARKKNLFSAEKEPENSEVTDRNDDDLAENSPEA